MTSFEKFTDEQISSLRKGGKILRSCLEHVSTFVEPGVTTGELDREAEQFIHQHNGKPAFKGYRGFPATLCTSINEQCVHAVPGAVRLQKGDLLSIDCGVLFDGLYTDACITIGVGGEEELSAEARKLCATTQEALDAALAILRAGVHVGDISATIQNVVERDGFFPVRTLTGHGIGTTLHQFPDIPNRGNRGDGSIIPEGAVLAIEPIVSAGSDEVSEEEDGWALTIQDKSLSAHFEHTILVTQDGSEILA